jgi:hypothetical protein
MRWPAARRASHARRVRDRVALLVPLWLGGGSLLALALDIENPFDLAGLLILRVWPAVAVRRHGLYSIDRLLNRTLVHAVLTALLVATYAVVAPLALVVAKVRLARRR